MKDTLEAKVKVKGSKEKVWELWTKEEFVKIWNVPFQDWHCPKVINDMRTGGTFDFRMEKKDGSEGFNYKGSYTLVIPFDRIELLQVNGRKSTVHFTEQDGDTTVIEQFEPEENTELRLQQEFCQSVLDKFKAFAEGNLKG
ncbi:SRPBCC domain-containing protein [Sphingobacterium mizutaii]|uniref:SRPBCC domain-containing protein n=1 Tax=Sphingobacterium mizutaii TaxID=1010 RepID=UPI001624EEB7|nr:SRPBCC domain-containing protein [Sphingobacterium mizutaii]